MKCGRFAWTFPLPGRSVAEMGVVAFRFALVSLALHAEVTSTRFCAVQRIGTHELSNFEKIGDAVCLLKRLVQLIVPADECPEQGGPEERPERGDFGRGLILVKVLADRWGAKQSEGGTTVWFEIDLPQILPELRDPALGPWGTGPANGAT